MVTINFGVASVMLLTSSYLDLKKREVPDKFWIIFGGIGVALQAYEILSGQSSWFYLAIAIILATVIGMGIFFLGLYGGADGKALVVLALLVPYYSPSVGIYPIAPLIVLTNGVLLSMLLPFALFFLNSSRIIRGESIFEGFTEPLHRKILASLLGYKSHSKPSAFQFSMEKRFEVTSGGEEIHTKKFDFALMQDDFETTPGAWVTPGIPLLVFFTAGYFVLLVYGDLVISLVSFIAHMV